MNDTGIENENKPDGKAKTIRLRVLTPVRAVYDRDVNMVIARTVDGDMGILYGHESRSALLADGVLRIFPVDTVDTNESKKEELLLILGGILTVNENTAVVLSDIAEYPDKMQERIDKARAEKEENKIIEQTAELITQRMELAIRQALVHMDVSAYPILNRKTEQE